jgi:hypothetical protein
MNNLVANQATKTMSSLEIAEITGKNHFHVLRDIKATLNEVGIDASKFGGSYLSPQGKELPCYNLPRRECDLIMSGYSAKYRLAIIDRWIELENAALARPKQNAIEAFNQMVLGQRLFPINATTTGTVIAEDTEMVDRGISRVYYTAEGRIYYYSWVTETGVRINHWAVPKLPEEDRHVRYDRNRIAEAIHLDSLKLTAPN